MAHPLDLSDAWAKLEHAASHIDRLRREIEEAGYPDPKVIPVRREYDAENRMIVWRIERIIQIAPHWSLIIGDAIHCLRATLDYLAWQLARRFFDGVEPQERRVIRNVQFPIVSDANEWARHPNRRYMTAEDAARLEGLQPFNPVQAGQGNAFAILSHLSNTDKHRRLHVTYLRQGQAVFDLSDTSRFRDCTFRHGITTDAVMRDVLLTGYTDPAPGQEVVRILISPTGPNPDVELNPRLTAEVVFERGFPVVQTLEAVGQYVATVLEMFQPST